MQRLAFDSPQRSIVDPRLGAKRYCRECGTEFDGRATQAFCSSACRKRFDNRRAARGSVFYDLFMELRFNRAAAKRNRVWSILCRAAANFRDEDFRDRAGRRSWNGNRLNQRNTRHTATRYRT